MSQLRSDIWCASFIRKHNDIGNYCVIARKGHLQAGQIFIEVNHLDGNYSLFAPAPLLKRKNNSIDLIFELRLKTNLKEEIAKKLESEINFDPDIWIIALETRAKNIGIEIV